MIEELKGRLVSLDVFRGITIAGMIMVNNPGNWKHVYAPLRHAEWHGWTPTDFIFPFFIFIVGVSMSFSLGKLGELKVKPKGVYSKIFRRTAIIFGLGLFLHLIPWNIPEGYNWFSDTLAKVRIFGVLQRIAVVYFIAALILVNFKRKVQIYWAIGLPLFYWLIMKLIPVPIIEEGYVAYYIGSLTKDINLAAYVDTLLLSGHTWKVGRFLAFDPEGILSTIPAISTALIGVFTGYWLKSGKNKYEITSGLFFTGVIGLVFGLVLDAWFPINKALWSPSYVVFMGGMALIFLAVCYYIIDVKNIYKGSKAFIIYGTNALAVYILAGVVTRLVNMIKVNSEGLNLKGWVYQDILVPLFGDLNGSLAYAIGYISFFLGAMAILYHRRIFIKI